MRQWLTPRGHCALGAVVVALGGCIVSDTRCGENQVLDPNNPALCHCAPGAVLSPKGYGCDKCGDNEIALASECVCAPGYVRDAAGAPCVKSTMSQIGYPCSESEPCTEPAPDCATAGGISFCTKLGGCAVNTDCPANMACFAEGDTRFCGRVSGLGKSCTASADCAGTLSTYCESFSTRVCLIEGCAANPGICPNAWSCCNLVDLIHNSICAPDAILMNGLCLDGSAPIKP